MAEEVKSSWAYHQNLPLGVLNKLNNDITKKRIDEGQSFSSLLSDVFSSVYNYDVKRGTGPYAAVVLDVITGPQKNNSAASGDGPNTKSSDAASRDVREEIRSKGNKPPAVRVIAKIPEFDADIPWPKDDKDQKRIQLHGEFVQIEENLQGVKAIQPGSIVWVQYANDDEQASYSGAPTGYIIGIHTTEAFNAIVKVTKSLESFNPACQAARNLSRPAGGLYVGNTEEDPAPNLTDMKIKSHIKTGIFGDGHARTKIHFNESLIKSDISHKHNIRGPAPGKDNAFIWVGHLKNNGYMDILDRPNDKGRETIIYAPATLDLNVPVEIKYYFHDVGGFGYAHLNGPDTTNFAADLNSILPGNDFKEKIAPAIKDLNVDGRNYILVIPEMAYSLGYGTATGDTKRIQKIIDGEPVDSSIFPGNETSNIRSNVDPTSRAIVKEYLSNVDLGGGKNLAQNTPLALRQLVTFDGSYTGGNFELFHNEVLDVLEAYIYADVTDRLEFVSFLGDGLGAVALASSLQVSDGIQKAVFNPNTNVRVDFITSPEADLVSAFYGGYFGTSTPSTVVYNNLLLQRDSVGYTEFNYITPSSNNTENSFFDNLGKIEDYKRNVKTPGKGASANKFSFVISNLDSDRRFVSMHVVDRPSVSGTKNKVGYAFSMINKDLPSFPGYPKKNDKNSQLKAGLNKVPDHAYALATKSSPSDLERLTKQQTELTETVSFFQGALDKILAASSSGFGLGGGYLELCKDDKYQIFCDKNGVVDQNKNSLFDSEYRKHLNNLKKLAEINILLPKGSFIELIKSSKQALEAEKKDLQDLLTAAKENLTPAEEDEETIRDVWEALNTGVAQYNERLQQADIGAGVPDLELLADFIVAPEAYTKLIKKVDSLISAFDPQAVARPADCVPAPQTVSEAEAGAPNNANDADSGCPPVGPETPANFAGLAFLLGYGDDIGTPPVKDDFEYVSGISKGKINKVRLPETFKLDKFNYSARGPNGTIVKKEGPHIWGCITRMLSDKWNEACEQTKYYPFAITNGVKGHEEPKTAGIAAYENGLSLHALGLAIDIDPQITGFSFDPRKAVHSVFTGAWNVFGNALTEAKMTQRGVLERLYKLGVYQKKADKLYLNSHEGLQLGAPPRSIENFASAPDSYLGKTDTFQPRDRRYFNIMTDARGGPIVPMGANPVKWVVLFCEKTGMKWGNGTFLKKRWRGGKTWNDTEKKEISNLLGVENVVDRVQNISWQSDLDSHAHFQYFAGDGIITWEEIDKYIKEEEL